MLNQAKNPGQQRKGQLPRFGELWDHDFTVLLCFFPPGRVEYLQARAINAAALGYNSCSLFTSAPRGQGGLANIGCETK